MSHVAINESSLVDIVPRSCVEVAVAMKRSPPAWRAGSLECDGGVGVLFRHPAGAARNWARYRALAKQLEVALGGWNRLQFQLFFATQFGLPNLDCFCGSTWCAICENAVLAVNACFFCMQKSSAACSAHALHTLWLITIAELSPTRTHCTI